jgi:hypothetical protein
MKNEAFNKFYEIAEKDLCDHEIEIVLRQRKKIKMKDNTHCAGYFDGETLAVATKNSLAEEVFVHEYCHFLQYKEKHPLWMVIQENDIFTCLDKKHFGIKDWEIVYNTIALERDCEHKALKLSKKYKLFDNAAYAKKANAYLYYYQHVFLRREWMDSSNIYSKKILDNMPEKLLPLSAFEKIDMNMMQIFEKTK